MNIHRLKKKNPLSVENIFEEFQHIFQIKIYNKIGSKNRWICHFDFWSLVHDIFSLLEAFRNCSWYSGSFSIMINTTCTLAIWSPLNWVLLTKLPFGSFLFHSLLWSLLTELPVFGYWSLQFNLLIFYCTLYWETTKFGYPILFLF